MGLVNFNVNEAVTEKNLELYVYGLFILVTIF